jgi:outer membrane lipoprotein carrier protein
MLEFLLLLSFLGSLTNGSRDANAIRRALEARYRHAATLKAAFYERYSDGKGSGQAESGLVYFSRPGRMRWEYESPQQKLFLVDGKNAWLYIPADHAASRAKIKESSDWRTPIALLAGKADLGKLCRDIELVDRSNSAAGPRDARPQNARDAGSLLSPADSLLRCTPRGSSDQSDDAVDEAIRDILLETDPEAHLVRVLVRQPGNLETEFRFGNWQENVPIAESKFHFEPPPGVEIVDEEKLAGQVR